MYVIFYAVHNVMVVCQQVKMSVVLTYIRACTFSMTGLVILFYVLTNASSVGSNYWLAIWSNEESSSSNSSTDMYVAIS